MADIIVWPDIVIPPGTSYAVLLTVGYRAFLEEVPIKAGERRPTIVELEEWYALLPEATTYANWSGVARLHHHGSASTPPTEEPATQIDNPILAAIRDLLAPFADTFNSIKKFLIDVQEFNEWVSNPTTVQRITVAIFGLALMGFGAIATLASFFDVDIGKAGLEAAKVLI